MIGWPLTRRPVAGRPGQGSWPSRRVKGWLCVGAYTLLLYATIPFARGWQVFLKNLFGQDFSLSINLIMAGVGLPLMAWLVRRMTGFRLWLFLGLILLTTAFVIQIDRPEERIHILEYAVLGYLVAIVAAQRLEGLLFLITALITSFLIGLGDELIQWVSPNRVFDWRDVIMNGAGSILGLMVMRLKQ